MHVPLLRTRECSSRDFTRAANLPVKMTQSLADVIFESAPTEASEEEQLAWCEEQMTELCGALENERENSSRLEEQLRHERAEISKLRAALAASERAAAEEPGAGSKRISNTTGSRVRVPKQLPFGAATLSSAIGGSAITFLKSIPLFQQFSEAQLSRLQNSLVAKNFPMGTRIIEQGDGGDHFYIIVQVGEGGARGSPKIAVPLRERGVCRREKSTC